MILSPYLETLRSELAVAAEAGGPESRDIAERLTAPLEAAARLTLLEALSDAAAEITSELVPGSVELRLRGREPEFVVTMPPTSDLPAESAPPAVPIEPSSDDDGAARTTLRLPESLKARIEQAAATAGISVNAWLVRTATAALEPPSTQPRWSGSGSQRYTGWAH